jgi:hypothetical protein
MGAIGLAIIFAQFVGQTPLAEVSTPVPTQTKEEKLLIEMQRRSSQSASSVDECAEILKAEDGCNVMESVERITRPEWEELFPQTEFFLVKYDRYGGEFGQQQRGILIIEQDGQRYTAETFDRLLTANDITITDENRELVVRAFTLITIPYYLEEEIVFTEWAKSNRSARFGERYNYSIMVWTKIQGLRTQWFFRFENGYLRDILRMQSEYHIGDYIDVPFEILPPPGSEEYFFRGQ